MNDHLYVFIIAALLLYAIASSFRVAFLRGLNSIPGPLVARFSGLYRLSMVYKGHGPQEYIKLHQKYGSVVRTGPNHVSIADASAIPTIYGIGSKFLKTPFYDTMAPVYKDERMDSMFTTKEPVQHKFLKSSVAQYFSMTNMRNYEKYADECTDIFIKTMKDLEGQQLDLAIWLQWYAFDVIGSITFQSRFGFLEQRKDIDSMIARIDAGLKYYVGIIGQFPQFHPYLGGNTKLMNFLTSKIQGAKDPLRGFFDISAAQIQKYDLEDRGRSGRTDFLSQLRQKQAKDGKMSDRDIMNHLTNNLLAGSDTTGISLRAVFYYTIKNPRVYRKLVEEIDAMDSAGGLSEFVTFEECLNLSYLQAVIKESMRMHPGVGDPLERFVPPEGATICGFTIPGRTVVSVSAPVIHHDDNIFGSDAASFRPERWLEASPEQLVAMDRAFIAFGHGSRTCIGKNISIMEMGKFIPQVFRHFDIEWTSPADEWTTHAAWFWKQSDMHVRFRSRHGEKVAIGDSAPVVSPQEV